MTTTTMLFELGTEELPPAALKSLSEALIDNMERRLSEHRLGHTGLRGFATPRRLAVLVEGLEQKAEDEAVEVFGPPADRARNEDGSWSAAAEGFARKNGVSPDLLEVVDTGKGLRLAFRSTVTGASAERVIPEILSAALRDLPVPKRMRWGTSRSEFVRPVQWLVLLLGEQVVDCELMELRSGRKTLGHRFHHPGSISLNRPEDYEEALEAAWVIADFGKRRELIREQVERSAAALNAHADIDEALLDDRAFRGALSLGATGSAGVVHEVPPEVFSGARCRRPPSTQLHFRC